MVISLEFGDIMGSLILNFGRMGYINTQNIHTILNHLLIIIKYEGKEYERKRGDKLMEEENKAYCEICDKITEVEFAWVFAQKDIKQRDYTDILCRECKGILLTAEGHIRFSHF